METKQVFSLHVIPLFKEGLLYIDSDGKYKVNDHTLHSGEIVAIEVNNTFIETSIHFSFQNMYSSIGLEIMLGQKVKYESDLQIQQSVRPIEY